MLAPLPNHLFTRDTSCWVYGGVSLNPMAKPARRRETVHLESIYKFHPLFAGADFSLWYGGVDEEWGGATIEGGDVLVIGEGAVLIGMGERTTPYAVERLAQQLFAAGEAHRVVAVDMPRARSYMHLDTVMTMVDRDDFILYAGLDGSATSYTIAPGEALRAHRHRPPSGRPVPGDRRDARPRRVISFTTILDVESDEREQWDDGSNVFAVEPGVVVGYERNVTPTPSSAGARHRGHHDSKASSCTTRSRRRRAA